MFKDIIYLSKNEDSFRKDVDIFIEKWESQNDYIIVFTSGSTGQPKQLKLKKSAMIASAKATGHFFNFRKGENILLNLSPTYIGGMMQIVRAWVFEMNLIVGSLDRNPLLYLGHIKIDFAAFVPLQVEAILAEKSTFKIYQTLRNVIIGGAPIDNLLNNKILKCSNKNYATFGMTETISHIALKRIDKNILYYTALPSVNFSTDARGCLVISAPNIIDTKISTNDKVELIDMQHFNWIGRIDFVINSGGVKIQPELVEKKINDLLIDRFYIIGEPSEEYGEQVVLVIESSSCDKDKLFDQMKKRLKKFELPKRILLKLHFEKTASGKILKKL